MSKNNPRLNKMVQDVFAAEQAEIYCDQAINQIALAGRLDLSLPENAIQFRDLLKHLQLCSNCQAEFELSQQLLNQSDKDVQINIPPLPDNGRFPISELFKNLLNVEFPGFAPILGQALTRGEELGVEPTAISLPDTDLVLEIDVGINENNQSNRDLFITLMDEADDDNPTLGEGSSVWLHQDTQSPVIQEQIFDELGDLNFTNLSPGTYTIRLQINNQQFAISPIQLP